MQSNRDVIAKEVYRNAALSVKLHYHEPSNTYIYYCDGINNLGIKGIGSLPNQAFENFKVKLEEFIDSSSANSLETILQSLKKTQQKNSQIEIEDFVTQIQFKNGRPVTHQE